MNLHFRFANLFSSIVDLVILNLLFVITSLPVFTLGASVTALYSVTLRLVRNEESSIAKAYFRAFKKNFAQATGGFFLLGIPAVLMVLNIVFTYGRPEVSMMILFAASVFFLCVFGIFIFYFFPVLARFEFTVKQVLVHIPHMLFTNFQYFVMLFGVSAALIFLFLSNVKAELVITALSFIIGWSLIAYLKSFIFRRIFEKYELSSDGSSCAED